MKLFKSDCHRSLAEQERVPAWRTMWRLKTAPCWLVSVGAILHSRSLSSTVTIYLLASLEKPFYLKEVYLPTECSDCLVVYEKIISGQDTFTSLLLFSKSKTGSENSGPRCLNSTVSDSRVFNRRQGEECPACCCGHTEETGWMSQHAVPYHDWPQLRWEVLTNDQICRVCSITHTYTYLVYLQLNLFVFPSEICPENIPPTEGLSAFNSLLEKKMGHRVAKLLDNLFDIFYNWFRHPFSQLHFFPLVMGDSKQSTSLLFYHSVYSLLKDALFSASCSIWCLLVLFWKAEQDAGRVWHTWGPCARCDVIKSEYIVYSMPQQSK